MVEENEGTPELFYLHQSLQDRHLANIVGSVAEALSLALVEPDVDDLHHHVEDAAGEGVEQEDGVQHSALLQRELELFFTLLRFIFFEKAFHGRWQR